MSLVNNLDLKFKVVVFYEGMVVRLESSAFDPDGDQGDLDYSWSAKPIQVSTNDGITIDSKFCILL